MVTLIKPTYRTICEWYQNYNHIKSKCGYWRIAYEHTIVSIIGISVYMYWHHRTVEYIPNKKIISSTSLNWLQTSNAYTMTHSQVLIVMLVIQTFCSGISLHNLRNGRSFSLSNLAYNSTCISWYSLPHLVSSWNNASKYYGIVMTY